MVTMCSKQRAINHSHGATITWWQRSSVETVAENPVEVDHGGRGGRSNNYVHLQSGEGRNDIPRNVTHLIVHESITVIPKVLFYEHPNLMEVYCHKGVTKIEESAFNRCLSLQRVIVPGVTIVETYAFYSCTNLVYHVECDKLERIVRCAFTYCESLSSINLPSAKIVEGCVHSENAMPLQKRFNADGFALDKILLNFHQECLHRC